MDEIDAALDFRNVSVIADYIKDRTKDSQFIIISLRNQMFENANELIGIYKTFDITKVVIFNPNAYDVRGNPIVIDKKKKEKENIRNNNIVEEEKNNEKEKSLKGIDLNKENKDSDIKIEEKEEKEESD